MDARSQSRSRSRTPSRLTILTVSLLLGGAAVSFWGSGWAMAPAVGRESPRWATVRRASLDVSVQSFGELNSARNTLIECEIEQMSGANRGSSDVSRYSTLLSVVPEGTYVKEGDILCEIDPVGYVELVRTQRIAVEESRSGEAQARLSLEMAQISLQEYRDGIRPQTHAELEVQVALARTDLQRQRDRLAWADHMKQLGYLSTLQFEDEREELLRCQLALARNETERLLYQRYTEPKMLETLETQVSQAETTHHFWRQKKLLDEQALALYKRQVQTCVIRAPHEGYVIYCVDDDDPAIQPGVTVRRHMDLFHLPDLSQLEVQLEVNQTMISRITRGMRALVQLESMPGKVFEGRVVQIPELPDNENRRNRFSGVSNYLVRVEIVERPDEVLLPGLTARVEILTHSQPDTLVVPARAVAFEDNQTYCLVSGPGGLERRSVTVEPGTIELLQVIDGLAEGERVALDPQDRLL